MIACPKCQCETLTENKYAQVAFSKVAGDAFHATRTGRVADALSDFIAWVGLQAANAIRNPHRCSHCGHTF